MSFKMRVSKMRVSKMRVSREAGEEGLEEALQNFRSSVHAWSEAEFVRPRTILLAPQRRTGHRAAAWALGCLLAAGSVSAGMYERNHHDQLARLAAAHLAAQQRAAARTAGQQQSAAKQAADYTAGQGIDQSASEAAGSTAVEARGQDEKLMAAVDQDVSQEVPVAMEPLAQLMDDSSTTR